MHLIRSVSITTEKFKFCENKGTQMKQKLSCLKNDQITSNWIIYRKIQYGMLSWFRHDDIVISSMIFDVLCTLPLCCPNDSQKCDWKVINTEKTQRKKRKEKTSFWKHKIGFLNFLRNITFNSCDLPKFDNFLLNSQTLNDARRTVFKRWLIISNFELLIVVFRSWE